MRNVVTPIICPLFKGLPAYILTGTPPLKVYMYGAFNPITGIKLQKFKNPSHHVRLKIVIACQGAVLYELRCGRAALGTLLFSMALVMADSTLLPRNWACWFEPLMSVTTWENKKYLRVCEKRERERARNMDE